jgi:hypothetical protein
VSKSQSPQSPDETTTVSMVTLPDGRETTQENLDAIVANFEATYDALLADRSKMTRDNSTTGERAVITKMINGLVQSVAEGIGHIDPQRTRVIASGRKVPMASTDENLKRITSERDRLRGKGSPGRVAFLSREITRMRQDLGLPVETRSTDSKVSAHLSTQSKGLSDLLASLSDL